MRLTLALTLGCLFAFMCSSTCGQEPSLPEIAKRAKAATALVETSPTKHGSAFCVHESGLYLTNEHVVRGSTEVKVVLHPGLKEQQIVKAHVVRTDKDLDLALLRISDKATHTSLPVGSIEGLVELTEVIATGFPFGKALASKGEYPNVSVNTGRISALRLKKGELDRIQMDAVVNPGNSGGPVLDRKGKVIGVVVSGVPGATVNFAIPANHVQKFVARPEIDVKLPTIAFADRFIPATFEVRAATILPSKDEYLVELILGGKGKSERSTRMEFKDGVFRTTVAALPPEPEAKTVRVSLTFPDGSIQGTALVRKLTVGKETFSLTELRTLRFEKEPMAVLTNGQSVVGPVKGFDELTIQLGSEVVRVNPTKAREISVVTSPPDIGVTYTVIVRQGKDIVARTENTLTFSDVPRMSPADPIKTTIAPPPLTADVSTVKLPGPVEDLAVGGNGRYLALHIPKIRAIVIFDVSEARIVHTIQLTDNHVVFAAGMDKLVLAYPNLGVFSRYSLATGEREANKKMEFKDKILRLAMGSASNGPIFVGGPSRPDDEWLRVVFLDIDLQVLPAVTKDPIIIGYRNEGKLGVRASGDGRTFAMWAPKSRPTHLQTLLFDPKTPRVFGNRDQAGSVIPSHDGSVMHTSFAGQYNPQAKPIEGSKDDKRIMSIPALGYPYYLRIPTATAFVKLKELPDGATVHFAGDSRTVATIPISDDMYEDRDAWGSTALTIDKRIHFVPDAKVIIQLPRGEEKLLLYKFDMDDAIAKADFDYLFVTSTPPSVARRGELFQYAVQARSKQRGITCKLLSGPGGLKVTPAGLLMWDIPTSHATGEVDVVVTITDASKREIYHSFKVIVQ